MANWSYKIQEGEHKGKTLWSGRYTAVSVVVVYKDPTLGYRILVNKRGVGTPNFRNKWNMPCGFLEDDETAYEGASREVYEETGIKIDPNKFKLINVETDPKLCFSGHVSLRMICFLNEMPKAESGTAESRGGEKDEVSAVTWVNENNYNAFTWAFNHKNTIKEYFNKISMLEHQYNTDSIKVNLQ